MTQPPPKPDLEKKGRINPWHVIERAADLHIVCRETAVLVDWIAALEARHKQLTALADTLENRYAARLERPLGRMWNKLIAGPSTKKRLKEIWKETEVTPDRIRLLVRSLLLNVCFIADSIGSLYKQIGRLTHECNQYAIANGLDEHFEPPDDERSLRKVAEKIKQSLKPARNLIAHGYRYRKTPTSVERAATLVELLQAHEIEMNKQQLVDSFRKFHEAARSAEQWFAHGMSLRVTTPRFYHYLGWEGFATAHRSVEMEQKRDG